MKPCVCGHDAAIHEHHRLGTDCGHRGCGCRQYRRRWWWRRTLDVPAAVSVQQALPPEPAPPPGPLPRHDTGPITWHARGYQCGCKLVYDGDGHITTTSACPQVRDLRQWDREMGQWEQEHRR